LILPREGEDKDDKSKKVPIATSKDLFIHHLWARGYRN
jgi:hypothetical protein